MNYISFFSFFSFFKFFIMVDEITSFNKEVIHLCVQFVHHDIREDFFCNMPN